MFDFHIHTHHSFDGFHSMKELTEKAISMGLQELCFTDHKDYDYDGEGNDFTFSYDDFFKELEATAYNYRNHIKIKAGVEFGLQPHVLKRYEEDIEKYPFDFIIGSIHSVKKTDVFTGDYFDHRNQQEAYIDYFDDLIQAIHQDAPFSVVGHLDMIKRYGNYDKTLPIPQYQDVVESIFKELMQRNQGIEVNTSGFRYHLEDAHPSVDLLQLYHQMGGEIVVMGSDTHKITELGFHLTETLSILHSIGFKYICTYHKLQPEFHRIESLL